MASLALVLIKDSRTAQTIEATVSAATIILAMFDFAATGGTQKTLSVLSAEGTEGVTLHELLVGDRCTTRAEGALGGE